MKIKKHLRSLLNKEITLNEKQTIPAYLVAIFVFVLCLALVLFSPRLFRLERGETGPQELKGERIYTENDAVVIAPQTAIYSQPDHREERLSSLIFDELVHILDKSPGKYWKIQTEDGVIGYVASLDLSSDTSVVEPNLAYYKAIVQGREKRLFSHARRGELLAIVPMGTVLYADYRSPDLLRVKLVDGQFAWVSTSDLLIAEAQADFDIPKDEAKSRFLSSLMAFHGAPRLPGQMTVDGTDLIGAVRIAARLNGIELPRRLSELSQRGERIELRHDPETGLVDLSVLEPGDLIFLRDPTDGETLYDLACVMEDQIVLMNQRNSSMLGLWDLNSDEETQKKMAFAIRLPELQDTAEEGK